MADENTMSVPNNSGVGLVQYFPEYSCICAIEKIPFSGRMEIEYVPGRKLLEFTAFDAWLKTLSTQEFTIEDLVQVVFDKVTEAIGYTNLSVTVHAQTISHFPAAAAKVRNVMEKRPQIKVPRK